MFVFLHRRLNTQVSLQPPVIIVLDVVLYHLHEGILVCKTSAIVSFSLQDAPEAFHRAVVDTLCYSGHALHHSCLFKSFMKESVRVLESYFGMEKRRRTRVLSNSPVKHIEYQGVVIGGPNGVGYDPSVVQVKDGTQIDLMDLNANVILELRNVCQPFSVRRLGSELSVQYIFCDELGICCLPGTAIVGILDRGFDVFPAADPQHTFIVYLDPMIPLQIVTDPPVAFVGALHVDLLYLIGNYSNYNININT